MKTLFASRASTKQRNWGRPLSAVNAPQLPGTAGPLRLQLGTRTLTFYSCRAGAGAGGGGRSPNNLFFKKTASRVDKYTDFCKRGGGHRQALLGPGSLRVTGRCHIRGGIPCGVLAGAQKTHQCVLTTTSGSSLQAEQQGLISKGTCKVITAICSSP